MQRTAAWRFWARGVAAVALAALIGRPHRVPIGTRPEASIQVDDRAPTRAQWRW
jgi:hypothetical protein